MGTAPLSEAELEVALAAIGGFEARPRVAVAVSGGADSMALILLADRWACRRGGTATALIVDHGLRPESAAEAAIVSGWLAARGIARTVLHWTGAKPASGVQAAAREARYRLLAGWCREHGVLHLLTAHHREDQAETYMIRRRAGSGADGLAAMAVVRELAGCRLVRPLLAVAKARLAAVLAAESQPFVSDPSNLDAAFERARLRRSIAALADPVADVLAETRAMAHLRVGREAALDRLLGSAVMLHPGGFAVLDRAILAGLAPAVAERLLGRLAIAIGARPYPPRHERLARLCRRLATEPQAGQTLGGCRFVAWRGRLLVLRELAAAAAPAVLQPGESLLWDRRWQLDLPAGAGAVTVGYLGQRRGSLPHRDRRGLLGRAPPLAHPVLPALWDAAGVVAVPHLGYRRGGPDAGPDNGLASICWRPVNPLTRARFTVV